VRVACEAWVNPAVVIVQALDDRLD